jgi:hypothetical protein
VRSFFFSGIPLAPAKRGGALLFLVGDP